MKRLPEHHSFTVTFPDGTRHVLKSSDHAYTHAVIVEVSDEERAKRNWPAWGIFSHHTSKELADRKCQWVIGWNSASQRPFKNVLVVPVTIGEEIK
jgi:hypothetical protein